MGIIIPVKIKGKGGEVEVKMLANSAADLIVLTRSVFEKIKPERMGYEVELIKVGGDKEVLPVFSAEIEVEDPETRERRKENVEVVVSGNQDICLLGYEAMEKLGILLDIKRGKYRLI